MSNPILLEVDDVTLQYKTARHLITATYKVNFNVHKSDRFVILGPSGCGKSTILKAVGGFIHPVSGTMKMLGQVITKPSPDRMMVFQDFEQLMPWQTVLNNVLFPMRVTKKFSNREAIDRALTVIDRVKLTDFKTAYPHMLSGGMKMRVAIARAMALEPEILLMDEPFAALDALTRRTMQQELLELWEQVKFTVLFVTHSIEEAILVGSRMLVLSPHPGQVRAELNTDQYSIENIDDSNFGVLSKKIHGLLFDETHQNDSTDGQE